MKQASVAARGDAPGTSPIADSIEAITPRVHDEQLEREVKTALETHDLKDIGVEVKDGLMRLTGTIPTGAWRLEAAVLARSIEGVRAVKDDLRVETANR